MSAVRFTSVLAVAVLWSACSLEERTIGIGQTIHHDDFDYSVERLDRTGRIADLTSKGVFYIVTFRVENRARAVSHRWNNTIAYVVDENGARFENNVEAQKALARLRQATYRDEHVTAAGDMETTVLVFDLPESVSKPCLKVRGSLLMGDVFDFDQYARTRIRLF